MANTTIAAAHLVTSDAVVDRPLITVDNDGRILSVSTQDATSVHEITHNFPTSTITAAMLDIHIHGSAGHDVMEGTHTALNAIGAFIGARGVARYLATTVTAPIDKTLQSLSGIADVIESETPAGIARPIGIHIEGPFVSHAKKGMHPAEFIVAPSPDLLRRMWEASRGTIKLMTIAPELPGAIETIELATQLGIRTSLGHSNATQAETIKGIEAGGTSATHTFNAMRAFDHREPGILGTALDRDDLYAELICDGIHTTPEAVRLWLKAKGSHRGILITDAIEATGMPDGTYKLAGIDVTVKDNTCTTPEGVLAGSVLTMQHAVTNLRAFTGASLATATRLASQNPSRMLGLPDALAPGQPASFNIYNASGERSNTILRGKLLD